MRVNPALLKDENRLISEQEAAEFLSLSVRTLQKYRGRGTGPHSVRIGARGVRYRYADLIDFVERNQRPSPSDKSAA